MKEEIVAVEQSLYAPDRSIGVPPLDHAEEQRSRGADGSFCVDAWCDRIEKRFDELERKAAQRHEEVMTALRALAQHFKEQAQTSGHEEEEPTPTTVKRLN